MINKMRTNIHYIFNSLKVYPRVTAGILLVILGMNINALVFIRQMNALTVLSALVAIIFQFAGVKIMFVEMTRFQFRKPPYDGPIVSLILFVFFCGVAGFIFALPYLNAAILHDI